MGAELEQIERFSGKIPDTKQSARHPSTLTGSRWRTTTLGLRCRSACIQVVFLPCDLVVTDSGAPDGCNTFRALATLCGFMLLRFRERWWMVGGQGVTSSM